jgi:hypothetical protein
LGHVQQTEQLQEPQDHNDDYQDLYNPFDRRVQGQKGFHQPKQDAYHDEDDND